VTHRRCIDGHAKRISARRRRSSHHVFPRRDESFTLHLSFKPHQYTKLVTSAAAALDFVKHIKPNLFLLQYHLPDLDGLALYDRLHETQGLARIPAIILGVPLPKQARAVIKTQQLVLLSTPIDLEELGRAIVQLGISFVMNTESLKRERKGEPQ
jgi:CheY-like chemotaxis protein